MARPTGNKTAMVRVNRNLLANLRMELPHFSTDNDRIANIFDEHRRLQGAISGIGGFLYGKGNWKKIAGKKR